MGQSYPITAYYVNLGGGFQTDLVPFIFYFFSGFNRDIEIEATLWTTGMDGNLTVWLVKSVDTDTQVIPTFGSGAVDLFGLG